MPVSKARTNKFYIYRQCTYIVYVTVLLTVYGINKTSKATVQQLHYSLPVIISQYYIYTCFYGN